MRRRHEMPFGAEIVPDGVRFSIWAPSATRVALVLDGADRAMNADDGGWYRLQASDARAGARYGFRIDDSAAVVPDPASRSQPDDVAGPSEVVDPTAFSWTDADWRGRPWVEAVITEVHVGTATPDGTFAALADRLEALKEVGFTAIELMPIADFSGRRNWGYDGVLPYAPDAAYGPPDDLKRLVDRAHSLGIMVLLDVVYNHFGPVGNYLGQYAGSFFTERHKTPWGAGLNFDGQDGRPVRDYFVHNALYWLEEYGLDGLRFDAVHAILDDSDEPIMTEIARHIRAAHPDRHVHLVLENEKNSAALLARNGDGRAGLHDAQWNDDIHHCWHVILTGETEAYYEDYADRPVAHLLRCLAEGFAYQGEPSRHAGGKLRGERSGHLPPSAFVAFLQNHDQIGNRAFGERLTALVAPERLSLARAGLLLSPQIPLLFMGDEWGAATPFPFFVDFSSDPDLSRAVRDGRRREFRHFAAFQNEADWARIPDPTDEGTFRRAVLDPTETERAPHAAILAETRDLLALRRSAVIPLTSTRFIGAEGRTVGERALDVTWRFEGGTLRFAANFGHEPAPMSTDGDGRPLWTSPELAGRLPSDLPGWTGFVSVGNGS